MSAINAIKPQTSTRDLLTWKDPVKTGKVFGITVGSLIVFKMVNLINIFFHLSYIALLFSAAAEYAGKLVTGQGIVTKYKPTTKAYAKTINDNILPAIGEAASCAEGEFYKIIYSHDIETTLKAAGCSYVLYKLTSWFSIFTLLATSVILLFTVPIVYIKYQKEIDAAVAQYSKLAKDKTAEYTKLAQDKAAPHVQTLVEKSGPVGAFVKSKLPTRTAGSTVGDDRSATFGNEADSGDSEQSAAKTTGASKFPEVPTGSIKDDSTFEDLVEEARNGSNEDKTSSAEAQKEL